MTYRYYVIDCDVCKNIMGWTSDGEYPSRGIWLCNTCWANPSALLRHIRDTFEQALEAMK